MLRLIRNPRLTNLSSSIQSIRQSSTPLFVLPQRPFTAKDDQQVKTAPMDGCEACANAAYSLSESAFIYPITPSTAMSEAFDAWSVAGRKSLIGEMPVSVYEMQSEGGAAGAMHGAAVSGSLATTFTASQGLLLMVPNLYQFSGELLPGVFHVAARSLTKQALSIFGDHQDVMACRQTGMALLCSNNPQEAQDLAIVSHISTLKSRIPFLHFFDGWRTSSVVHKIKLVPDEQLLQMYPYKELEQNLRNTGINIDDANMRGTAQGPDIYFQSLVANNKYYEAAPGIIQEVMNEFAAVTGRKYELFEYYGPKDADRCIVMMGSGADTAEQTVDHMNEKGENVGLLKVRLYRPWSTEHFLKALPSSIQKIAVLDRTREDGALSEPLHLDITAALHQGQRLKDIGVLTGGVYGLSSKEFTPSMVRAVYGNLNAPNPTQKYVIGINDDVTHTSLPYEQFDLASNESSLPQQTTQCMFWGMGGDGTVGANKQSIKDLSDNTDLFVQAYFSYDAHKSGGVTCSHLRFGPNPIKAQYEIQKADYVSVNHPEWMRRYDSIVSKARFNATLVINSPWDTLQEMSDNIPDLMKKMIAVKKLKLYNIDAGRVAKEVGLGKRVNQIMQSVFYKLSGILPEEEAIEIMVNGIKKVYHDKGPKVVDMNVKAVTVGLSHLQEIEYPTNEWATLQTGDKIENFARDYSENTSEFVKDVLYSMADLRSNSLPVSSFIEGGIVPRATSKFEKRAISSTIPMWDGDKCTQCNYCSLVCPHAVIRPFLLNKQEIADAPQGFQSKKTKPPIAGTNYSIQLSPMDCTGCEVCVQQCPDDALSMVSYRDHLGIQMRDWEYSIDSVSNKAKDGLVARGADRLTVKGSQFHEPLCEFHGACGGCGESPYLKLMTQMFGKNVVIANATGCSSIWGGCVPNNPYSIPWANSLFEDNAEFGYGIASASNKRREHLLVKLREALGDSKYSEPVREAISDWISSYADIQKNNVASDQLLAVLKEENIAFHDLLGSDRNMLKKASQWIVGGDGWAYDIGFGGLDHVFAQSHNTNVNILVLDTEMYSNTGGQASKSTPTGASVKFAEGGQQTNKKDLGQIAMLYQNIYVASIALGADYEQTVNAFKEAESYDGISLIVAMAPCIDWGIDMKQMMANQKLAVDTGYWPLYRYDPRKVNKSENPFQLDSKRIREDLEKYLKLQNRFGKLERAQPEVADKLHNKLEKHYKSRHERLIRTSLDDEDYFSYLQQKLGHVGGALEDKEQILVLYGSETGNARSLSDIIGYELKRRNTAGELSIKTVAMDDYDFNDLLALADDSPNDLNIIFAISTCGQGEFPKNCQYFMKDLLGAELKGRQLSKKLNYAVFGLGDSNYVYFNEAAKILDETLHKMGANRLIDVGMGNDQDEDKYDTAFEEWSPDLFGTMQLAPPSTELMDSTVNIDVFTKQQMVDQEVIEYIPENGETYYVPIKTNTRLTSAEYDRDFRHYEFDTTAFKNEMAFDVGDCLGISPINDVQQVETLCDLYNIKAENIIRMNDEYNINVYDLFARKLDILGKPKRRFYELLSMVATDENEKKYLNNLINDPSFEKEFKQLRNGDTSTYIDLLLKFKSCRPELNYLIEYIPEIKQRLYSIANSPAMTPNQIDLFVLKDDWYTETDNVYREGLCTKYLEGLQPTDKAYAKIHGASVNIADNHSAPLLLTGLGSGLAPLRAHVQDRVVAKSGGENVGECALIFGSRNRKNEYFYQDEFEEYHASGKGVLTHLLPAFSRDQDKKYYVTDRLREESSMVHDYLINKKGYFYYCGAGGNVPEQVRGEISNAFVKHGNMNEEQAEQKIVELQLNGHYNVEAW